MDLERAIMLAMDQLNKVFGTELRSARRAMHMDQHTLAETVNVTRSSISNIESGRQAVSLTMFCNLCSALNKDPASFLEKILTELSVNVSTQDVSDVDVLRVINKSLD